MGLLAMSRALGDHFLRPYVIAEPEVSQSSCCCITGLGLLGLGCINIHITNFTNLCGC
jgi:hypothetical protein